jgi:hypothetical protein
MCISTAIAAMNSSDCKYCRVCEQSQQVLQGYQEAITRYATRQQVRHICCIADNLDCYLFQLSLHAIVMHTQSHSSL